ncbi:MAG: YbaN family protein [Bacteroidales bacterium]|jgi:uncharacterized membrane protein YbaN (DUF454 family)|nr:YbaN family protein [Bacteroidales bacterium]MDD3701267.1 YbaN family protein [Bacteroidales bacterium]MDY0368396.1 YbaN family protein [Bacteroidales bacterium]
MKKTVFILLGSLSLLIGMIGIVVPGLPTTPFLLLAAYLYSRSSKKLQQKLLDHRLFGGYIRDFSKGMSVRAKIRAVSMMWVMIFISSFVFLKSWTIRIVLFAVGIIGTYVMSRLPERKEE